MPRQLHPTHRLEAKQKKGGAKKQTATKPWRNAEKAGCKEAGKDGGGKRCRPEIRDARRLWNAAGGRLRLLRRTATATPQLAQPMGAGVGTGSCGETGKKRGAPGGGSAPQQCGERGPCARSLYSVTLRVSAPFPPTPQEPRLFDARPGDLIHM